MAARTTQITTTYALFFLSGIAGLGYQIVWTRMFSVGLGHELPSLLAVVTAFFGGFALGAALLDRRVSDSKIPGHWYAGLEVLIGVWALISIALIPWMNARVAGLTGVEPGPVRHWSVAFLIPWLTLLPATAAMGATLPAMDRLTSRLRQDGRSVGGLYAVNTLGAVFGTIAAAFLLVPRLGYPATIVLLAACNFACAAIVLLGPARGEVEHAPVPPPETTGITPQRLWFTAAATGLLGIGYEVVVVRVLGQVLENTVFSFASALSVYLLGTAIGAAIYQRFFPRGRTVAILDRLLHGLCAACAFGIVILWSARSIYESRRLAFGGEIGGSILAEMFVAATVFLVPSMLMGATFSHIAQAARHERGGVGAALALNTLGGAVAPFLFGVALFGALGGKFTIIAIACGYLVLAPTIRFTTLIPSTIVVLIIAGIPSSLLLIHTHHGEVRMAAREGIVATAAAIAKPTGELVMSVNNKYQMGGTGPGEFLERRQAHIPLLLHPAPKRALFLGVGTGITFAAADDHPELVAEGVELLQCVVDLMGYFRAANSAITESDRLTLRVADARRFVRASRTDYDVIIADLFHPSRDGSGSLYTSEHFATVRGRLAEGGLFCQWLPLFQLDERVLRMIVRTFLDSFPSTVGVFAYFNVDTPVLGLIGSEEPVTFSDDGFEERTHDSGLRAALNTNGLIDAYQLLGCFAASREALEELAGDAPRNTDLRPRVTFEAPRFAYRGGNEGRRNLAALLDRFRPRAAEILAPSEAEGAESFASRLDGYFGARDRYLRGAILVSQGDEPNGIEAMLESLETSPQFRIGYDAVIEYANRTSAVDKSGARAILERLRRARPDRAEADAVLRRMAR